MIYKVEKELPIFVDDSEIIFESLDTRPDQYKLVEESDWDVRIIPVNAVEDLPVVGAQIYSMHESVGIFTDELPGNSETGYRCQRLQLRNGLDNFYRYPVLVTSDTECQNINQLSDGVIVWMTAMDIAALLPKIPLRILPAVLEDIARRFRELKQGTIQLHSESNVELNGDILNSAVNSNFFSSEVQRRSYELYEERQELTRIAYGIWIKAFKSGDSEEFETVKLFLAEALEVKSPFLGARTIADLKTTMGILTAETRMSRYFEGLDLSKFFDGEIIVPPTNLFATEVYGYEMSELIRKGLFAEIVATQLLTAMNKVLNTVAKDGENILDVKSAKWLAGLIYVLTNEMLSGIPVERASKMIQPTWDLMEQKFNECDISNEFGVIIRELVTYSPQLAEAVIGKSFL